jgi:YesN/AraC family two-component response regulator
VTKADPRGGTDRVASVLLVDDEPEILEGLRRTLRHEPYRLVTALSADEALRVIATDSIDVIISDIDMPGTNGLELIARIRRDHPTIVRLLLTGDASLESALHAINQGEVHRFLVKPWSADELRDVLRSAVERLDELRGAAVALGRAGTRERLLAALEKAHPGITRVEITGDTYIIETAKLATWIAKITEPRLLQAFGIVDEHADLEGTRRLRK